MQWLNIKHVIARRRPRLQEWVTLEWKNSCWLLERGWCDHFWKQNDVKEVSVTWTSLGSCGIETGDYWTSLRVVLSSLIPLPCFLSCLYECSESCVVIWAVFTVFRFDFRLWKLLYPFVRINSSIIKVSRWNSNQSHIRTSLLAWDVSILCPHL